MAQNGDFSGKALAAVVALLVPLSALGADSGSLLVGLNSPSLPIAANNSRQTIIPDYYQTIRTGVGAINISAGRDDPAIFTLAAAGRLPIILMHMQGTPKTMQQNPSYGNVVKEVADFLLERRQAALAAG